MESGTANKIVAFFALGGVAMAIWTGQNAQQRYHKVWGVTILSIGGAALADFAPQLVGPFFVLVIFAYIAGHQTQIGNAVRGIKSQAGVSK